MKRRSKIDQIWSNLIKKKDEKGLEIKIDNTISNLKSELLVNSCQNLDGLESAVDNLIPDC